MAVLDVFFRIVPGAAALELCLLGTPISAARAAQLGIVNEVVPAAELDARVHALASQLASAAPLALRGILDAIHTAAEIEDLRSQLRSILRERASENKRQRMQKFAEEQVTDKKIDTVISMFEVFVAKQQEDEVARILRLKKLEETVAKIADGHQRRITFADTRAAATPPATTTEYISHRIK